MIQRALYVLPFVALLAGFGFAWLWQSRFGRAARGRWCSLASPIQFGYFYFDYFTHYKFRSAFYYDPVAFRDVAAHLIGSRRCAGVLLHEQRRRCEREVAVLHADRRAHRAV